MLEPGGVGHAVKVGAARAVDQAGVTRRGAVRVQALQRIDEHAGNVLAPTQHLQRVLAHLAQVIGFKSARRIARTRLHIAPPAMVGTAEPHQMCAAGVVARQAHGLHHGLGTGHVERHFVHAGNLLQPFDVVADDRMVVAQHRSEVLYLAAAFGNALLVKIVAKHVDAEGARQVVKAVAVQIRHRYTFGRLEERTDLEQLAHQWHELERYAVVVDELHVRNAGLQRLRTFCSFGIAFFKLGYHTLQCSTALRKDFGRCAVRVVEAGSVITVSRQQRCRATRHARMSRQRAVLGQGKFGPRFKFLQGDEQCCAANGVAA